VVADVNGASIPVVAIDLPSGLSADSHQPIGDSIEAGLTVTLAAPKISLILPPAETRAGDIVIADIGIPADVIAGLDGPHVHLMTRGVMRELVGPRMPDSHKGDYGHVLVVAGSRGKTGAAHLAATGALRSGAGLVTVATPACCQPIVAAMAPEYMTEAVDERTDGLDPAAVDRVLEMARDVVAIGPGLGQGDGTREFIRALVDRATMPVVIDADGLNAFAGHPERLAGREGRDVIITPHPGEMGRLIGMSTDEVQASRLEIARNFATGHRVYVVLKGHRTLIAAPDGKVFINPTGNAGMATGGTGDVLTGMVAAWLAQLLDAEAACQLAVYLHGMAGDLAEADEGEVAMTAGDVAAHIGDAIMELTARRKVVEKNGA
jgi:NAD(P)H-hydrate epimerase